MELTVRGKNIEVTPSLKEYAARKVGKIERYFDDSSVTGQIMLSVEKDRHIVEVTMSINGLVLRGEEATGDMYASIDLVVDKIEKQVQKYKTRITRRLRQPERAPELPSVSSEDESRVVKVKRFVLKPMSVEEAMMQMNLVGHDFYVFANSENDRTNILYRRHDGDYGLIDPEH